MAPPDGVSVQGPVPTDSELQARNLWAGGRLLAAATAFVFIAFVFAFYYLRELNVEGKWRQDFVHPATTYGVVILACVVASALIYWFGTRSTRAAVMELRWLWPTVAAFVLALAALMAIAFEIPNAGFHPSDGAYASVFFAWTGFLAVFVLGGVFYLETLVARGFRAGDEADPIVLAAEIDAFGIYWIFMALMTILTFVLLYVVA